jgi:tRNA G18 (ribose-2'-O)-methylase SpoU
MAIAAFIPVADADAGQPRADAEDAVELARFTAARDRDLRGKDDLFLVESPRVLRRFLQCGWRGQSTWRCRSILVTPELWPAFEPMVARREEPIRVYCMSLAAMTQTSGYRLHGGALALGVRTYWPPSAESLFDRLPTEGHVTVVVANGVVQVDNVGSIFRNAACFGAAGVLLDSDCADPLLRKVIRFSMGRVFDVPWGVSRDLPADLERLAERGVRPLAIELGADAHPIRELPRTGSVALVVGNETNGVASEVLRRCAARYAIPGAGPDEDGEERSLNVAVASAIALHQRAG